MADKQVLIIGTRARGGIRAVIEAYEHAGFYAPGASRWVAPHDEGGLARRLALAAAAYAAVARLLLTKRVALMHLHVAMRGSFWRKALFLALGKAFKVPVVLHLHGSQFAEFYGGSAPRVQALIRRVFDAADAVVVLSDYWRDYVGRLTSAPVVVIRNFVPAPGAGLVNRDPYAALFLGQFGRRKGIYDLLPAFGAVHAAVPAARLTCGGNGEIDAVRAAVAALGAGGYIAVPGWVAGEAKAGLMAASSVFVLPSYNEGLPMAIIEAMAYGMAIVSTRVGGIPELVIDGENGYLVESGNQDMLAAALLKVLGAGPSAIAAMGARSRAMYEARFAPAVSLGLMRELYARLGVSA